MSTSRSKDGVRLQIIVACVLAAAGHMGAARPQNAGAPPPAVKFVSDPAMKAIMAGKIEHAAETLWNADEESVKTADGWKKLDDAAADLVDAAKSLLQPPLAKDQGKWKEESERFIRLAQETRAAITKRDLEAVSEGGGRLLEESCTPCHQIYFNP